MVVMLSPMRELKHPPGAILLDFPSLEVSTQIEMSEIEEPILEFAIDVTERLSTIAQGVGAGGNYQFCSALAATLSIINQQLRGNEPVDARLKARLPKLLSNLEKLCKVWQPK